MMHRAWSGIVEVLYCFSRSYDKFQGHTALKIVEFDPNWAFPDCKSSLNSPMPMKCCTKLEIAKERCPIVFQGDPSNFKVTRYKTSPIFTQIGHFRTIGRSQLSNPSDLPCFWLFQSTTTPTLVWSCGHSSRLLCWSLWRWGRSTTSSDSLKYAELFNVKQSASYNLNHHCHDNHLHHYRIITNLCISLLYLCKEIISSVVT